MNSIPASQLVQVVPSVLGAGGNPLALNAVFVDNSGDTSIPLGTVQAFPSAAAVAAWYGANSIQATLANVYFSGFAGANQLPGRLYFSQYNGASVAAYLRGGVISAISLATLQGYSGTLTIVIDGVSHVTAAINLSSATSFTNAAALITAGLAAGTPASTAVCSYDSLRGAFVITSPTTGGSSAIAFPTTATLATDLLLTSAAGAVLSQGAVATTPAAAMNAIAAATQNWAAFMTVVDPDSGAEPPTVKLAFANWVSTQSPAGVERFGYVAFDSDLAPTTGTAAGSFAALVTAAGYNGVVPVFDLTLGTKAAFQCSMIASTDRTRLRGAIDYSAKGQAGLVPDVYSASVAQNLIANGYNFYGAYATANQPFQMWQPGSMPGSWKWADEYFDQIWLNNAFQLALMELLASVNKVPFNALGDTLLNSACMDPINSALFAGVIQPGTTLSNSQAQQVDTAAGKDISSVLSTRGWYLQLVAASAIVRAAGGPKDINFWYTSGGAVRTISVASVDVQ